MPHALFPCPRCQQPQPLEFRQAGQLVKCASCGAEYDAPKLRELKQFSAGTTVATESSRTARTSLSRLRNWMFAAGLGFAVVGVAGGYVSRQYASGMVVDDVRSAEFKQQIAADLDAYSPAELWATWDTLSENRVLPDWDVAKPRKAEKVGESLMAFGIGLYAAAALGSLALLGSFLIAAPPRR